jgi:hypothetical protein
MKTKTKKHLIVWSIIFIIIVSGTIPGSEKGIFPFFVYKTGTSYGVNFSCFTIYREGSIHNGLDLSLVTIQNPNSKINGLGISVAREEIIPKEILEFNSLNQIKPTIFNGCEISFLNCPTDVKDDESYVNRQVNGLQIGIYNASKSESIFQIGLVNQIKKLNGNNRNTIGVNFYFEKKIKIEEAEELDLSFQNSNEENLENYSVTAYEINSSGQRVKAEIDDNPIEDFIDEN